MKLGFNTSGNSQTNNRTTLAISLGKLRNTTASTTRKFKYCNARSPDLNVTFNCVFNENPTIEDQYFNTYHILTEYIPPLDENIPADDTILQEDDTILQEDDTIPLDENIPMLRSFAPQANIISSGPFSPSQIKKAYSITNVSPLNGARKPIITIITAFYNPYLVNDVTAFGRYFGLPPCNLKLYNLARTNTFNSGWAIEVTLDVQWAYAINPNVEIRVIFANSNSWTDIFNAINFSNNKNNFSPAVDTDILSMSFGSTDNGGLSSYNNYFNNTNTLYVASSGDTPSVSFPSSCTNVLSIGGTSLRLNSDNSRNSETVWSSSGVGFSKSFPKPSYQPLLRNTNLRITPDVSCLADPITGGIVIINGKLYTVGGTSLSAPIYAGMLSLVQQTRLNSKKTTYTSVSNKSNSIQPILYSNTNKTCYYDIVSGSSGGYSATTGFDIPSGLGVFNTTSIIQNLS